MAFSPLLIMLMIAVFVASLVIAFFKGNIKHHLIAAVILVVIGFIVVFLKGWLGDRYLPEEIGLQYAVLIGIIDQIYYIFILPIIALAYSVFKLKAQYLKLED